MAAQPVPVLVGLDGFGKLGVHKGSVWEEGEFLGKKLP